MTTDICGGIKTNTSSVLVLACLSEENMDRFEPLNL